MIFGERIRFRAIERDDLPTFVRWINDPKVQHGIGIYLPFSMVDEEDWFEETRKRSADEHNLAIEVSLPRERADLPGELAGLPSVIAGETATEGGENSWKLIGSCGFFNLDQRNRSSEFGIMIGDKSNWNKGYGTEAVRLLCQHGFNTLNLNRIYLRVLENNLRAIRAYEKAGFTHEGRQRQAEFRDGKYIDMLVMSMLKEEF
jgi:RimJ/RimL family protein N-acetyltransferase